jgi:hypothetical protein
MTAARVPGRREHRPQVVDVDAVRLNTADPRRDALRTMPSLATLTDPSAIQEQLDRIQRAIIDDPERTCPPWRGAAQEALGPPPCSTTPGTDGSAAVKKILGAVSTIATSLPNSAPAATAPDAAQQPPASDASRRSPVRPTLRAWPIGAVTWPQTADGAPARLLDGGAVRGVGCAQARATLPAFRQEVHTFMR